MSQHDVHSLSSDITWSAVKDFYVPDISQLDRDAPDEDEEDEDLTLMTSSSSPVFATARNPPWIPPRVSQLCDYLIIALMWCQNVSPKTRLVGRMSSDDRPGSAASAAAKSQSSSSEDLVAIEERKSYEYKEKMYAERRHFVQESHLVGARSQLKEEK